MTAMPARSIAAPTVNTAPVRPSPVAMNQFDNVDAIGPGAAYNGVPDGHLDVVSARNDAALFQLLQRHENAAGDRVGDAEDQAPRPPGHENEAHDPCRGEDVGDRGQVEERTEVEIAGTLALRVREHAGVEPMGDEEDDDRGERRDQRTCEPIHHSGSPM